VRLLELANGLAQRIAVRTVAGSEFTLAGQSLSLDQASTQDLVAQISVDACCNVVCARFLAGPLASTGSVGFRGGLHLRHAFA
jgi:hypothetical protein